MNEIRAGNVLLAQAGDHIEGYREATEKVVQVVRAMRARRARAFDRGGELTRVSWTTVRDHENHGQARSFIRAHRAALLASEAMEVSFTLTGGGTSKLVDAVVTLEGAEARGIRSWISYEVLGAEE